MGFVGRILPVFIGWIIWRQTGNIILGAIVAVALEAFIGPIVNELGLLFVRPVPIKAEGEVPQGFESKGIRVLTGKRKGCGLTSEEVIAKSLEAMNDNSKFITMLRSARELGLPEVAFSCEYENKNNGVLTKTFREWNKDPDISNLFDRKEVDDRFFAYDEPNGEYFATWMFSREIPVPAETEAAADGKSETGNDGIVQEEAINQGNKQEEARSGRKR